MQPISRRTALKISGAAALGAGAAVGALTESSPAAAATDWYYLPIVTVNIGRNTYAKTRDTIEQVRNDVHPTVRPLVGWQEINEGVEGTKKRPTDFDEMAIIRDYFPRYVQLHPDGHVPISVPPHPWNVVRHWTTKVHDGIKHVSPARYITEAIIEHESHPRLQFALLNRHFIAGAFNGKVDTYEELRKKYWREMFDALQAKLRNHAYNHGRLVIWTADVNRQADSTPLMDKRERRSFGDGVDQVGWLTPTSGPVRFEYLRHKQVDLTNPIDFHRPRAAYFRIRVA